MNPIRTSAGGIEFPVGTDYFQTCDATRLRPPLGGPGGRSSLRVWVAIDVGEVGNAPLNG